MRRKILNITSFALGILLLTSISGMRIYSHHCNESGYENTSFIEEHAECNHTKQIEETTKPSCCSIEQESKKSDDCCNTVEKEIKLDVEFDNYTDNLNIKPFYNFLFAEIILGGDETDDFLQKDYLNDPNYIPPAGKDLLLIIQGLRTEPAPNC